jgi:hypothetical protein
LFTGGNGSRRPRGPRYDCRAAGQGASEPAKEFTPLSSLLLEFFFVFHLALSLPQASTTA